MFKDNIMKPTKEEIEKFLDKTLGYHLGFIHTITTKDLAVVIQRTLKHFQQSEVITDNSKVNENLLKENEEHKRHFKDLQWLVDNFATHEELIERIKATPKQK